VDIDGHAHATLTLFDQDGDRRIYDVPSQWTTDVTHDPLGWQTLLLNTLSPQASESNAIGGDAIVILNEIGFDSTRVVALDVAFDGNPSSAGLDNLQFMPLVTIIPEPSTVGLGLISMAALMFGRRRSWRTA